MKLPRWKGTTQRTIFATIGHVGKAYWPAIMGTLALNILQTLIGNYTFVAFQHLLDGIPGAQNLAALAPLLAWYIGANIGNHTLIYLSGIPSAMLEKRVTQWVKLRALEKIARIDYLAYQNIGTGNLIQVVENGADATYKILTSFLMGNLAGVAQIFIGLYFIRSYDRTLFAYILGGYGLFYIFSYYLMRFLRAEIEKMIAGQENFSKFSVRAFMELVVFRVNGRFRAEFERLKDISDEIVLARTKVYLLQELSYTGFALLIFLIEAGVVVQQTSRILAGASTLGTLVALVSFIRVVFSPIIGFSQSWMEYRLDVVTFAHFAEILNLPDDPGLGHGKDFIIGAGAVEFQRVGFRYHPQPFIPDSAVAAVESVDSSSPMQAKPYAVIRDFSLRFDGGKTTALVGASGSGKSTLMRLLLHLLKPESGRILVDGQDLAHVNLETFYAEVAYVPQEPPVFDGTLRENLTFDRPIRAETIGEAIRQAGLTSLFARLPKGLETPVGERGIKLSGGERQRLAFARILLLNPRIIILDEPTSALDSITEQDVIRDMAAFLQGRTVIIVAHRLQTVKNAHQIVVLEAGQIVQSGTFAQLFAVPGLFRRLWDAQMAFGQALPAAPSATGDAAFGETA